MPILSFEQQQPVRQSAHISMTLNNQKAAGFIAMATYHVSYQCLTKSSMLLLRCIVI